MDGVRQGKVCRCMFVDEAAAAPIWTLYVRCGPVCVKLTSEPPTSSLDNPAFQG
jgi:hypothetical protein